MRGAPAYSSGPLSRTCGFRALPRSQTGATAAVTVCFPSEVTGTHSTLMTANLYQPTTHGPGEGLDLRPSTWPPPSLAAQNRRHSGLPESHSASDPPLH